MSHRLQFFCLFVAMSGLVGCGVRSEPSATGAKATATEGNANDVKSLDSRTGSLTLIHGTGELGSADYLEKKSCTFTIRNDAQKTVSLVVSDKSCACSGVEIKPPSLGPNETGQVTLHWTPLADQMIADEVRVTATVQAVEDPKVRVTLEGRGQIRPALFMSLPRGELDFGRIDVADLKQGKELAIEVYAQEERHKGFTLQATSTSPGLRFVPAQPQPLTQQRLDNLRAVAGYRLNLQCGEGLPVGRFREAVKLKSNLYADRVLDVTVVGWVESGAVTVVPDAVALPENIPLARGYRCPPIEVTLRGEPDRNLKFVSAEPAFLRVAVEAVRPNVWRVLVSVPAGEEELRKQLTSAQLEDVLSYGFNEGAVTFETNHSRLPTLRIPVPGKRIKR